MASPERSWSLLLASVLAALLASPAAAQEVGVELMFLHASNEAGPIDAKAREVDRALRGEFKYESLRVLETQRLRLGVGEQGSRTLPTGSAVRVRPVKIENGGVVLDVEIEGTLRTNLKVTHGHWVVIGAQRYQDGKLVVTLRPTF